MEPYQMSFDDIAVQEYIQNLPQRYAYIDECGSFGFDFSKPGNSTRYILCAVIVEKSEVKNLHNKVGEIKKSNGYANAEMKSNVIGSNDKQRARIIGQFLPINFRIVLLIADKQKFAENSPLTEYKKSFIKYLHQRLYDTLYHVYPKLSIIEDEVGTTEFQSSFKKYVAEHRPISMFNSHDFDYVNSKDELLVQLADVLGGSISRGLDFSGTPNYLEMLKGKILSIINFPNQSEPYWGTIDKEKYKFNADIYTLAMKCAFDFIDKHKDDEELERRAQIAFLKYLCFNVTNLDPVNYIYSNKVISYLSEYLGVAISKDFLFRRVVAQVRDEGVIIASSKHGYKIPISIDDIVSYLNATHTIVAPMLHRMGICRNLIKQCTNNELDVLDDVAFMKYKKYFD